MQCAPIPEFPSNICTMVDMYEMNAQQKKSLVPIYGLKNVARYWFLYNLSLKVSEAKGKSMKKIFCACNKKSEIYYVSVEVNDETIPTVNPWEGGGGGSFGLKK